MSSQTSSSWALPAALTHPKSTDAAFIGHTFKWAAHSWQIHQKTANKRGPVSWVWYHGSELWEAKGPISKKAHWLCHRCWDRGVKKVLYTSSTTPAIEHMKDQHQWNSDGPIPQPESTSIADQILPDAQATFSLVSKTRVAFFRKLGISETRKRLDWAVPLK
jgi:hypothetical protein